MRVSISSWILVLVLSPAAGGAQDVEPNDTFEQARPIPCSSTFTGTLGGGDLVDFFVIGTVPASSVLRLDVTTQGTCVGGATPGASCTDFTQCPGGFCDKPVDLGVTGYDLARAEIFTLDEPFILGELDPVGTIPLRNPAPAGLFLEVFRLGPPSTATPYTLSVSCSQPLSLSCPVDLNVRTVFAIEPAGDMDVYRITLGGQLGPRRVQLDVDAEGLPLGDGKNSSLDSSMQIYDSRWKLIADSGNSWAPDEDPLFSDLDSFIRTHAFTPGDYYVTVTCDEDLDFSGCPEVPFDPALEDFDYRLERRCRQITPTATICRGFFVTGRLDRLPEGSNVDFYQFGVTAGDLIALDLDSGDPNGFPDPNASLNTVLGAFDLRGTFLDGAPLLVRDTPTCEAESIACNDDALAPTDDPNTSLEEDSYLEICAPATGSVVAAVSNVADSDFNGLSDEDHTDPSPVWEALGDYTLTLQCTRPDGDLDSVTDCLDNCPAVANAPQTESDGDGIGDVCDNCPQVPNPTQVDRDLSGIGDACQCGDVNGDGATNSPDALLVARGEVLPGSSFFGRCDVNGDGLCNADDALEISGGGIGSDPSQHLCPAFFGPPGG